MSRGGRIAIDNSDFETNGIDWDERYRFDDEGDYGFGGIVFDESGPEFIYNYYTIYGNYITIWGQGLFSFGAATLAQQHFMAAASPGTDPSFFPGEYIALSDFGRTQLSYGYDVGVRDFIPTVVPPDPFSFEDPTLVYSRSDAEDVTYISFDFGTFLLRGGSLTTTFRPDQYQSGDNAAIAGTPLAVAAVTGGANADRLVAGSTPSYDYNADLLVKPASVANRRDTGAALSLDGRFDYRDDANIDAATLTPHASVRAEWSGGREAYSFTVGASDAGQVLTTFDIDETIGIDTVLRVYRANGSLVELTDGFGNATTISDDSPEDPGSPAPFGTSSDAFATALLDPGKYVVEVGSYQDTVLTAPAAYTLHVSYAKPVLTTNLAQAMEGGRADGLGGNDVIVSGAGDDLLDGGAGVDTVSYERATGGVVASLFLGRATGFGDDRLAGFENLTGGGFNDVLRGDAGANQLSGGGGNDTLDGAGGDDVLLGGIGDDLLTGGAGADYLIGQEGVDTLAGGAGANTLQGGAESDIYLIENAGDSIIEGVTEGTADEARTGLAYLVLPANVERLLYTGTSGFLGIGNSGNNVIIGGTQRDDLYGREGNDTLVGGTGAANTLLGGTGDDIYVVSASGDSTSERVGEGTDEVRTDLAVHALQNNVENLTYTGVASFIGIGNTFDNIISGGTARDDLFGREGNDTLIGGAGAANTLIGQEGNDTYIVSAVGDSISEVAGQGYDVVRTSLASFVLPANVEQVSYTGTAAFTGIGNSGANALVGGSGADFLSALEGEDVLVGGSGADILLGGAGADQFRFQGGETGFDRIMDFASGVDRIALSNAGFSHTATFALVQGSGSLVAQSIQSTFFYRSDTGMLSFDPDGTGGLAAIALAQLNAGLTLRTGDFLFF